MINKRKSSLTKEKLQKLQNAGFEWCLTKPKKTHLPAKKNGYDVKLVDET